MKDIGKLLKEKRKEKKLTLEEAGKLIGVSKVTYRDYELNNIKSARMDKLGAIAKFLEMSPEQLFNDDNYEVDIEETMNNIVKQKEVNYDNFMKDMNDIMDQYLQVNEYERREIVNYLEYMCKKFNLNNDKEENND